MRTDSCTEPGGSGGWDSGPAILRLRAPLCRHAAARSAGGRRLNSRWRMAGGW
ncbi:hypothetical protein SAMN05216259_11437 [Actinacidiphila guanduensis]|uniref:Uncharacterized protein n=1 Tax=Actinacidiphila guanduensis TaxID=310781 RepID=A0A1H0NE33_9ACTN|nr:hypothetical protein SAMN05216259_11437 [Actinacidiphila guanduensis]